MGCGAAKSANARADGNTDDVEVVSSSVTQIRDMAPAEVADTGGAILIDQLGIRPKVAYEDVMSCYAWASSIQ
ncbi:hypothetical protein NPIL_126851 [Nephila pilipes]|uniref:Uncharacterized protein n=1 Tax=Nephila pilipes TaxID=299642 RepID=A0A8X6QWY2_NEPPI|nr:hypothetical protein NPIL_126851 [Nephila pilipes]